MRSLLRKSSDGKASASLNQSPAYGTVLASVTAQPRASRNGAELAGPGGFRDEAAHQNIGSPGMLSLILREAGPAWRAFWKPDWPDRRCRTSADPARQNRFRR